jgi:hypothetical protein
MLDPPLRTYVYALDHERSKISLMLVYFALPICRGLVRASFRITCGCHLTGINESACGISSGKLSNRLPGLHYLYDAFGSMDLNIKRRPASLEFD